MAANRELLHEGLLSGLTAPRIVTERTIAQMERILAIPPEESVIVVTARVGRRGRSRARSSRSSATRSSRPTRRGSRPSAASTGRRAARSRACGPRPNGEELYRTQILAWTTLDLDPDDLHQIGLDELQQIEAERREIAPLGGLRRRHGGVPAPASPATSANIPETREEAARRAREDIERALRARAEVLRRTPRAACEVRAVEEFKEADAPFAYYFPPSVDG